MDILPRERIQTLNVQLKINGPYCIYLSIVIFAILGELVSKDTRIRSNYSTINLLY